MIFKKLLFIFIVSALSLEAEMTSRTQVLMGTYVTIEVEEKDKNIIEDGFNIFNEIDRSISSYNKNSPIFKLNRDKKSSINSLTYEALSLSKEYYKKSDGYFDITIGSITKDLFHFGEQERIPSKEELQNAKINLDGVHFNKDEAYLDEGLKLDLGGMGKGFGVDKVSKHFKENGIRKAVISASGDIRCLDICAIDVQNPYKEGVLISFKTSSEDIGISTSGNYNRYVESTKNNHLINPKSKSSQDKFISITLISHMPNSDLDAYATAASVMPMKKAYTFLNSFSLTYVVLQSDGELIFSDNFSQYTQNLHYNFSKNLI